MVGERQDCREAVWGGRSDAGAVEADDPDVFPLGVSAGLDGDLAVGHRGVPCSQNTARPVALPNSVNPIRLPLSPPATLPSSLGGTDVDHLSRMAPK